MGHRAYRRLAVVLVLVTFSGGVWMVAMIWEVIRIGGGPGELSLVSTCSAVGIVLPAVFAGGVADRMPQKRILVLVAAVELGCMVVVAGLSLADVTHLWHLAVASSLIGITSAFYFPAYSAWLPTLVPPDDLLAANGVEGVVRPVIGQAVGPGVAGLLVGAASPGWAIVVASASYLVGIGVLLTVPQGPLVRRPADGEDAPFFAELVAGVRYVVGTRWVLVTLLFAAVMILCTTGPFSILLPFVVKEQLDGGPEAYAVVVAALGVGAAVGSLATASLPLPRRYLTLTTAMWALSCVPLVFMGAPEYLVVLVVGAAVIGALSAASMVIWGTLLQRLVPPAYLGRVSSLDFFVSLALAPVSMALVGPLSAAIGIRATFAAAAALPVCAAALALGPGGLLRWEREHPVPKAAAQTL